MSTSYTLPHLSHATLLAFTGVCSATLLVSSWGGVGWGSHLHTCHMLCYAACLIPPFYDVIWHNYSFSWKVGSRWCADKKKGDFGKFQNANFNKEDIKIDTAPQRQEHFQ